jgi:DNA-binding NarL/FixJ family response regulator
VVVDLNGREQRELAWQEGEDCFRAVAETASDAIIIIDDESRMLFVSAAAEELINAIRLVAAGDPYLDKTLTSKILGGYIRQKSASPGAAWDTLTEREEEVLRLVAQGFINKETAAKLNLSVKTVESHKSNFMQKLGPHSRAEIVRYALSQGWLDT